MKRHSGKGGKKIKLRALSFAYASDKMKKKTTSENILEDDFAGIHWIPYCT